MKPTVVSADVLFEDHRATLKWEWVAGLGASERRFDEIAIRAARSGADLVGYLNYIHPYRVQILGEREVAYLSDGNPEDCAIASSLAAELFGLDILRHNIEDAAHNTTRFYVMAARPKPCAPGDPGLMTTFVFRVRNVPAALYKALGGFATNGVNMTKLESYMVGGHFTATQFLCDVEGHPEQPALRRALEELTFFSRESRIMGVYPAAQFRRDQDSAD